MENLICPVCGKGKLIEGESSYTCNYLKSLDDKCGFIIWKKQYGILIDDKIAEQLCLHKKTDVLTLQTREGKEYQARLVINVENQTIFASSEVDVIDNENIKCPKCQSGLKDYPFSFKCENEECDFNLFKKTANHILSMVDLEKLLTGGVTDFYDFEAKNGKVFTSALRFDDEYNLIFDNELCKCPVCSDGIIRCWETNCSCSNKDFTVWRNQNGATNLTPKDVVKLCTNKETRQLVFKSKEGNQYNGKLVLNDDYQIITVK